MKTGASVVGESKIFYCKKKEDCRIRQVRLLPEHPKALPEALTAIREADMIVLGPGSLYTSIIPNLLVDGVAEAIQASDALKIYVCNVMTQEGETEGYTVSDHIAALFAHSVPGLFDLCLTNSSPIPRDVAARYAREGAEPLYCDRDKCAALGVEVVDRPIATVEKGFVRHHPDHLARELILLHAERSVRIAGEPLRLPPEHLPGRGDAAAEQTTEGDPRCPFPLTPKMNCAACRCRSSAAPGRRPTVSCSTAILSARRRCGSSRKTPNFAARLPKLFHRAFNLRFDRQPEPGAAGKMVFQITERRKLERITDMLGYDPRQNLVLHINFAMLEEDCCGPPSCESVLRRRQYH